MSSSHVHETRENRENLDLENYISRQGVQQSVAINV